jgi:hypothetical protein
MKLSLLSESTAAASLVKKFFDKQLASKLLVQLRHNRGASRDDDYIKRLDELRHGNKIVAEFILNGRPQTSKDIDTNKLPPDVGFKWWGEPGEGTLWLFLKKNAGFIDEVNNIEMSDFMHHLVRGILFGFTADDVSSYAIRVLHDDIWLDYLRSIGLKLTLDGGPMPEWTSGVIEKSKRGYAMIYPESLKKAKTELSKLGKIIYVVKHCHKCDSDKSDGLSQVVYGWDDFRSTQLKGMSDEKAKEQYGNKCPHKGDYFSVSVQLPGDWFDKALEKTLND